jgi:DNA-binding winged helix-turn-helix (wHTH) protein
VKFGPFEVTPQSDELRKNGIRIRLSGQPFQILLMLLERPGELVTRDRLRERLWHDGTFVDFEGGLNAAINKLRRALNDSADKPRYIETVSGRGYRFIGHLETIEPAPDPTVILGAPRRRRWLWVPSSIAALTAAFLLGWRLHNSSDSAADWRLTQLTSEGGISETPALSPDGKLIAYSSDRGGDGQRDLYIKQIAGGQPIRLTFDGAGNTSPNFSPDGGKIVFRSERERGGIYVIPSFGGEARLLASDGRHPRFSPDGSQVAYWIGAPGVAQIVPGSGAVWVVPVVGGEPRRIGPEFTDARFPLWSPDGKYLLVAAYTASTAYEKGAADWWLAPVGGGKPIRTGAYDALARVGLDPSDLDVKAAAGYRLPQPGCWLARGDRLVFSIGSGDTVNIWETVISSVGKITGAFQRFDHGCGQRGGPDLYIRRHRRVHQSGNEARRLAAPCRSGSWKADWSPGTRH